MYRRSLSTSPLSLATWLSLLTLAFTVLVMGSVVTAMDARVEQHERGDELRLLQHQANALGFAMQHSLLELTHTATPVQLASRTPGTDDPEYLDHQLAQHRHQSPGLAWLALVTTGGQILASHGAPLTGAPSTSSRWWDGAAIAPLARVVHGSHAAHPGTLDTIDAGRGGPVVVLAWPAPTHSGGQRIWVAHLQPGFVRDLMRHHADYLGVEPGVEFGLIAGIATDSERRGPRERTLTARSTSTPMTIAPGLALTVQMGQPERHALAGYHDLRRQGITIAVVVSILGWALMAWVLRLLMRPLRAIEQSLGDPTKPLGQGPVVFREALAIAEALARYRQLQALAQAQQQAQADALERQVVERTRELQRSVQDLESSRAEIAAILEHTPDAFIAINPKGRVLDWNHAATKLFGYTRDEVVGRLLQQVVVPEDQHAGFRSLLESLARGGRSAALGVHTEAQARHKDGTLLPVDVCLGQVNTANGSLVFGFLQDIRQRRAVQEQLAASERRLHNVLDSLPALVAHFDRHQRCIFANQRALELHGLTREQAVGMSFSDAVSRETYDSHRAHIATSLKGHPAQFDGYDSERDVFYQVSLIPEQDVQGVSGFFLMTFNVTPLKRAQMEAEKVQRRLAAITDNLPMLISYIDARQYLVFTNAQFPDWTGIALEQALNRPLREVLGDELYLQRKVHLERALAGERVEFEVSSLARNRLRHLQNVYVPDIDSQGHVNGVYTLSTDVTSLREAERKMAELAMVDLLTGLPNRRAFEQRLPVSLAQARRHRVGSALLFLDVDKFKQINDTHGHATGDLVLQQVGLRLKQGVRATDLPARA
jgi:PAS domain S-box-containing protein